jgi:hypothetical protein
MKHIFLVVVTIIPISRLSAQDIAPAPTDKAVVYFLRPSSTGFAINFSYFDSTRLIGRFNGPKYIRYECAPGRHLFWARSENRDFVEAEVEAGKIYFLEAIVRMGAFKAAVALEPVDLKDSKKMTKLMKLMVKRPSEKFTAAELQADEENQREVITRGMEKYAEEKSKGMTTKVLTKDMHYRRQ